MLPNRVQVRRPTTEGSPDNSETVCSGEPDLRGKQEGSPLSKQVRKVLPGTGMGPSSPVTIQSTQSSEQPLGLLGALSTIQTLYLNGETESDIDHTRRGGPTEDGKQLLVIKSEKYTLDTQDSIRRFRF